MIDPRQIPLGAKPDTKDPRDLLKACAVAPETLPRKAKVRHLPPIKYQGQQNSCTGQAVAWFWEQVLLSRSLLKPVRLSPLYPWYYARLAEGVSDRDSGVTLRAIMGALQKHGAAPVDIWPDDRRISDEPDDMARAYGAALRLPRYERCETLAEIRHAIAVEDQSVVIGLPIHEIWYGAEARRTGIIGPPDDELSMFLGRHAMVVCGYDDDHERITLANSWGTDYGDRGFNHVSYARLSDGDFDAWTAGFYDLPEPMIAGKSGSGRVS